MRNAPSSALLILVLAAVACTAPTVVVPSPSPTAPAAATATPAGSPTASPRALRPFTGVLPIAPLPDTARAPDRGRVAYLNEQRELAVVDAGSTTPRVVRQPQDRYHMELDRHALRGDTLVFLETRTDGQRTDTRAMRMDLATNMLTTLDDHSGPFLGGGDTWRPRPPVTNGREVLWIRVDDDRQPFGVHVVLLRAGTASLVLHSGSSIVWVDLDERGRVLISKLIGDGEVAELLLWDDGRTTPLGTRPSASGGPAFFLGDRVFWQLGSGIVARSEGGELIEPGGPTRPVGYAGCSASGPTGRYLVLHCGGATVATELLDPANGERHPLPGVSHTAGGRAVAWREGTQWWLGTIAQ